MKLFDEYDNFNIFLESLRSCKKKDGGWGKCKECPFRYLEIDSGDHLTYYECAAERASYTIPSLLAELKEANSRQSFDYEIVHNVKMKFLPGAYFPVRAHEDDAGLDLRACEDQAIPAKGSASFDTKVCIQIPQGYFGKIESKSGLNVKHDVISCGGVIDSGYNGSIVVKLYNLSDEDYEVKAGDKIAQLILMPYFKPIFEVVEKLEDSERGTDGFGSSGR